MKRKLVYYIIIVFSVVIVALNNSSAQSMPMLAIMCLSPMLVLSKLRRYITQRDIVAVLLVFAIFSTGKTHPEAFRLSTVLYSAMFVMTYMYYTKLLPESRFTYIDLMNLCSFIIKAYAIVLIIQQVSLFAHIPVLNGSYNISGLKSNGLSNEPAHTGRILPILFYTFIKMKEIQLGVKKISLRYMWKNERKTVLAFSYTLLSCVSVTCMISFFLILLYFIPKKYFIPGVTLVLICFVCFLFSGTKIGNRILTLIPEVMTLDAVNIFRTDGSSAARIGPYIVYAQEFDLLNLNTWLGYGCDYGGLHAYSVMVGHEVEENLGVGGMINFLYDYGLISFIPFLILIIQNTGVRSFGFFLFIFIYSTAAFNMYTLWIFVILTYSIWYFKRQNIIINYNSVTTR